MAAVEKYVVVLVDEVESELSLNQSYRLGMNQLFSFLDSVPIEAPLPPSLIPDLLKRKKGQHDQTTDFVSSQMQFFLSFLLSKEFHSGLET